MTIYVLKNVIKKLKSEQLTEKLKSNLGAAFMQGHIQCK